MSYRSQRSRIQSILESDFAVCALLRAVRDSELPDAWLTAGAVYQTVWNVLSDRPTGYGIHDYDVCYFDASDLRKEAQSSAESRLRELAKAKGFATDTQAIEVVNQARVHLWFDKAFGFSVPQLESTGQSLERYACTHHAIAVRLGNDEQLEMLHPFGLDDILSMTLRPNRSLPNRATHERKAARAKQLWPNVTVEPW